MYVDDVINDILDSNNTWTGTNDFTLLPTCSQVPTTNNQLTNKLYVDGVLDDILDTNNVWSGTNDFTNASGINVGEDVSNYVNLTGSGTIVSLGYLCGNDKAHCIALGRYSGQYQLGLHCISLGNYSGRNGTNTGSVNIGSYAGLNETYASTNNFSINIGYNAGREPLSNSIVLNASGIIFNPASTGGFYVNPIREVIPTSYMLMAYDTVNKEIVHNNALDLVCNSLEANTITSSGVGAGSSLYNNNTTMNIGIGESLTTGILSIGSASSSTEITGTLKNNNFQCLTISGSINIGTDLTTGGVINIGNSSAETNLLGLVEYPKVIYMHDNTTQIATTGFVYNELTTHNIQQQTTAMIINQSGTIIPDNGPIFAFYKTASGSVEKTLSASSRSLGMAMEFIKTNTTEAFTINCAASVYICYLGDLEVSKVSTISFSSADTYMRLICPKTSNLWHIVQQY